MVMTKKREKQPPQQHLYTNIEVNATPFGKYIIKMLREQHKSISSMAFSTGIPNERMYRIIRGNSNPLMPQELLQFATYFDISFDDILTHLYPPEEVVAAQALHLVQIYHQLNDANRSLATTLFRTMLELQ